MNNQVINVNHIYEQKQTWRSRWTCTLQCQSIIRICKMWEEGCVYMRQSFIMNKLRFRWKWHVPYAVIGLYANKYTSHNHWREKRFQPYKGINAQKAFWKTVSSLPRLLTLRTEQGSFGLKCCCRPGCFIFLIMGFFHNQSH